MYLWVYLQKLFRDENFLRFLPIFGGKKLAFFSKMLQLIQVVGDIAEMQ
jgi:hypothetical protein